METNRSISIKDSEYARLINLYEKQPIDTLILAKILLVGIDYCKSVNAKWGLCEIMDQTAANLVYSFGSLSKLRTMFFEMQKIIGIFSTPKYEH